MSLPDLVLSLADSKQMLGLRYAEWATRAPTLEADIAAAAMGLDELGHSRVLYGCLEPLGGDPRGSEVDAFSYRAAAYFDRPWSSYAEFVAANAILDTAYTTVLVALAEGEVELLQSRLRKMLQEERYHFLHGRSWRREGLDPEPEARAWREALEFFGPPGGDLDAAALRAALEEKVESKAPAVEIDWAAWDPLRRRCRPGAIDEPTFAMLRGLEERRFMPAGAARPS